MPKWILALTGLLLVLEALKVAGLLAEGPMELVLDAGGYWRLAGQVIAGDWWLESEPIAHRTPLYIWLLAIVRRVAGDYALLTVVALQGVLVVLTVAMAGWLARLISGRSWAMPLAVAILLPGVARVLFARAVLTETLFTFLLTAHLVAVVAYGRGPTLGRAAVAGALLGLTLLTRPVPQLLWLVDLVLLWWAPRRLMWDAIYTDPDDVESEFDPAARRRAQLGHLLLAGTVCVLLVGPWVMRNRELFGRPSLTEFMGRNLWIVTFQEGAGAGLPLPETTAAEELQTRVREAAPAADLVQTWDVSNGLVASGLSDAEADRLMLRVAGEAIQDGPTRWAERTVRRIVNFWRCAATDLPETAGLEGAYGGQYVWHRPVEAAQQLAARPLSASVPVNMALTGALTLALLLLWWRHETRPWAYWGAGVLLYFGLVTAVFEIPNYRYRLVIEPLAAALVAAGITLWILRPDDPPPDWDLA